MPDAVVVIAELNTSFTFPGLYVQILKDGLFTRTSTGLVSRVLLPVQGSSILSASRFICSKWDQTSAVLSFRKPTQPAVLKQSFSLFASRKELLGKKTCKRAALGMLISDAHSLPTSAGGPGRAPMRQQVPVSSPNSYCLSLQESL